MERESETGHPRRWAILAALVRQPAHRRARQHRAQRRPAGALPTQRRDSAPPRPSWSGPSTRTHWSSPDCCSPAACSGTGWAAAGSCSADWSLFGLASLASAYAQIPVSSSPRARRHGDRRCRRHAVDTVDHLERLRPPGAWPGDRRVGERRRHRRGARPRPRRRAAGALLVGLGLPDQRADRGRRPGRGRARCRSRATRKPGPHRPRRRGCCRSSAWSRSCTASSTAASTASPGPRCGRRSRSASRSSPLPCLRAAL